ncbi:hypothetical protein NXZ77_17195 [Lysinibacillus boronitolerans]|uniref:hypothetical protein n=1 Tax=Lysinibacillus boronitolerans TaxID=309788 RepID=UPI0021620FD2|nr:hypothetical protein [Lysinibacillus boronitolerans]MCS1393308.1 hypothetical protein [Lysinibacillus boronitolerans]
MELILTIFLMLDIPYNYFHHSFPIMIEYLGNLGFWLAVPLSVLTILLSLWLLIKKVGIVSSLLILFITGILLFLALFSLFHCYLL